ncbi:hypothetical protein VD0004_g7538 [Verticillium dahliae]|nr:hypothetical protein VD0004_g7538 [Verticillium dahliae]PNH69225.1 hypothetical protein VD0001_g7238 [Verticillium dahliae]
MSIPGTSDLMDAPPPPLPPPRFLPDVSEHHDEHRGSYHREPSSYSPREYGHSAVGSFTGDRLGHKRRESGAGSKGDRDEGYASLSSAGSIRSAEHTLPSLATGFGQLHNQFQLESGADALMDMKKKLDPIKTLGNRSPPGRSLLSASVHESFSRQAPPEGRLPALSLPNTSNLPFHIKSSMLDSPDRFTQTPMYSAVSPRSQPFPVHGLAGGHLDAERSPPHRSRRINSDDASTQGSHEAEDMEISETSSLKRLRIEDPMRFDSMELQMSGTKRRASSPLGDDSKVSGALSQSDLLRRRDMPSRGSPTPRLSTIPQGSVSSVSSTGRTGSFNSGLSLVTGDSMFSSLTSHGHLSPGGLSPGGLSPIATDHSCSSPYSTPMSLNPSPRGSISRVPNQHQHQRNLSDGRPLASPRKLGDAGKPAGAKMQGFFMCECCPKKPKKFDTAAELGAHEAEKQYECSFCGNRFKNKNEAERHQNSLHVRRHSWSCSALSSYDRAFHDSTNRPGEADSCGYCGEEFPRSGRGPGASAPRHATDQNWEERIRHLQEVHKFRECNSSKKFFRADHFRQHLKHSHAGTSGKWTNMLENACMLEEDPTPR